MPVGALALGVTALAAPSHAQVAVRAETIHTMAGPAITNGVVLVAVDGRIERVGPAAQVRIPSGYRVLEAKVVTPGLIDAHATIGLTGIYNVPHDQDQLEKSDPIQPELRAMDAYNARERLVEWVRGFGVTTLHTGHGPGALMSGQTMVVKTRGASVAEAVVDTVTMVAMTLGPEVSSNFAPKSPGTRAKGVAMLRAEFLKAQEYERKRAVSAGAKGRDAKAAAAASRDQRPPDRDLRLEMVARVLKGEVPALVTAHKVSEILAALRLQKEFGLRLVLDGAAESYLVVDEIKAAGVPVILHPTMARHRGALENATLETAKTLKDAGIAIALQSGFEGYVPKARVVLFEAAMASAYGLSFEQALAAVTIDAARIIGQDRRLGSIERGKDGDLALFDGDPFEYTTHVCAVVIQGEVVSDTCR